MASPQNGEYLYFAVEIQALLRIAWIQCWGYRKRNAESETMAVSGHKT